MSNVIPIRQVDHQPPVNYAAEQALLGAIICNNEVFHQVDAFLKPEHFADALHGRIYGCCSKLIGDSCSADIVTLKRFMDADLALQGIAAFKERGGGAYIIQLAQSVVTITGAVDYAREIVECFTRRSILDICDVFAREACIPDLDVKAGQIIERLEGQIARVSNDLTTQRSVANAREVSQAALAVVERALKTPNHIVGLSAGVGDIDYRLGGLRPSLIILAGRPSMGKTTFALKLAHVNSRPDTDGPCGVYIASQEMSRDQIGQKFLALETGIGTDRQSRGQIDEREFGRLMDAGERIAQMEFEVDDASGQTVASIKSRARRFDRRLRARGGKLVMVVIDYIQLMRADHGRPTENRVQELSEITRGLQAMWKDLDVPVVALSQLSRALEARDDKRPQLADLRESGSIEQDADVVIFLYREEYYLSRTEPKRGNLSSDKFHERIDQWNADMAHAKNVCEIIIAKNRLGQAPMLVETYFDPVAGDFRNLRRGEIN